jgi:hypothetical protein
LGRPVNLQTSTVDQHVQRAVRHLRRLNRQQLDRATADRGVIRPEIVSFINVRTDASRPSVVVTPA